MFMNSYISINKINDNVFFQCFLITHLYFLLKLFSLIFSTLQIILKYLCYKFVINK